MPTEISSGFPSAETVSQDLNISQPAGGGTSPAGAGGELPQNPGAQGAGGGTSPSPGALPGGSGAGQVTQGAGDSEPMYEVTVGGKKWRVPVSELTKGYQRTQDYTRKTMELAEQRRAWEQERSQHMAQVQELQQWLQNPQNVYNYYQQLAQRTGYNPQNPGAQPGIDPQVIQRDIDERMSAAEQRMQVQYMTNQYKAEIDKAIEGALGTNADLRLIRGIEKLIREDVAGRDPANIQEALALVGQVAAERAQALQSLKAAQAAQAAQQQAPLRNGIEPPGGTAPGPQAQNQKFALGSNELTQAVLKDIAALSVQR